MTNDQAEAAIRLGVNVCYCDRCLQPFIFHTGFVVRSWNDEKSSQDASLSRKCKCIGCSSDCTWAALLDAKNSADNVLVAMADGSLLASRAGNGSPLKYTAAGRRLWILPP